MASVIAGRTDDEVAEKLERYRRFTSEEGKFIHTSTPFHRLDHPQNITVREALEREGRQDLIEAAALPLHLTVGQYGHALDEVGVDGINLRQYHSFETARDFAELVAPELRRRGRLREEYTPGETMRERIFGEGARLPDRHFAARYRGGSNL